MEEISPNNILKVSHISASYQEGKQRKTVLHDISFELHENEILGLVGESGCGKSTLSKVILGFIRPDEGEIISQVDHPQMIFQDPFSSLNPAKKISWILEEPLRMQKVPKEERKKRVLAMAERVGLSAEHLKRRPHELSGGQRQRVLIAMALTRDPKLVIADEPTTALDVTVQKQVIDLLNKLQHELGFAMVFVSHDLALVAEVANSITVMYAGQVVEQGPVKEILTNPVHEYTRGLLGSVLSIEAGGDRLHQVPGSVPSPKDFPEGDRFRPRSSHPDKISNVRPMLKRVKGTDHYYAELPDSELKRVGIKPYLTGGAE